MAKKKKVKLKSKPKAKVKVTKKEQKPKTTLPEVLGGPPQTGSGLESTENLRRNSMLIIDVSPCTTSMSKGTSLYSLSNAWGEYVKILGKLGFNPNPSQSSRSVIRLACQAESFPTDSFSNEYGDSFISQVMDIGGKGISEIAQMTGQRQATGALESVTKQFSGSSIANGITAFAKGANEKAKELSKKDGIVGNVGKAMNTLLAGARVDFPQIWKNSSYHPNFSCSIRLYNPNPGNKEVTKKFIIGPIAAILTLALPQFIKLNDGDGDSNSYSWPFFCKVNCPGIFNIPMGAITNVSIVKGGDHGVVGFNQILSMVDIRLEFASLHNVMLLSPDGSAARPTLKRYLNNLENGIKIRPIHIQETIKSSEIKINKVNKPEVETSILSPGVLPRVEDKAYDAAVSLTGQIPPGLIA